MFTIQALSLSLVTENQKVNSWPIHDNSCSKTKTINSQLTNSQSQALAENNSTFNTQNSTLPKASINVRLTIH